jgi:hypothetical protein
LINPPTSPGDPPPQLISKLELHSFLQFLSDSVDQALEFSAPSEELSDILKGQIAFNQVFERYPIPEQLSAITELPESWVTLVNDSKNYYSEARRYKNFLAWRKTRNTTRAKFEAEIGYDIKHAGHCLRLLYQALAIYSSGLVIIDVNEFPKAEGDFIRRVLKAEVPYEELKAESDRVFDELKTMKGLPKPISMDQLQEILLEILYSS